VNKPSQLNSSPSRLHQQTDLLDTIKKDLRVRRIAVCIPGTQSSRLPVGRLSYLDGSQGNLTWKESGKSRLIHRALHIVLRDCLGLIIAGEGVVYADKSR
jgi:hypothetical protein